MAKPFIIAQVSDLHIKAGGKLSYGVVDTAGMLRACVAHMHADKLEIAYGRQRARAQPFRQLLHAVGASCS